MSTGTQIIEDALRRIKVVNSAVPSDPEQISNGLVRLQSLMHIWLTWGIVLGVTDIQTAGEDLNEPIDSTNAIKDNLALMLAPDYSIPVTVDLQNAARIGLFMIKSNYQELEIPDKVPSSTLVKGAGNSKGIDARVFFNPDGGETIED